MDNESANYYTREVMVILIREFQSPDEEMKKIVLKVIYPFTCGVRVRLSSAVYILLHRTCTCVCGVLDI